jgi:hypothetical protein
MTEPDVTEMALTAGIGGYGSASAGTVWIDDLSVSQIDRMPVDAPLIKLQSAAKRQAAAEASAKQDSSTTIYLITILIMAMIAGGVYWLMRKPRGSARSTQLHTGNIHADQSDAAANPKGTDAPIASSPATQPAKKSVFYEEER